MQDLFQHWSARFAIVISINSLPVFRAALESVYNQLTVLDSGKMQRSKRRALKACKSFRNRKVRCNVVQRGAPCTNCEFGETEYLVTKGRLRQ